jgi:hypothetical protein
MSRSKRAKDLIEDQVQALQCLAASIQDARPTIDEHLHERWREAADEADRLLDGDELARLTYIARLFVARKRCNAGEAIQSWGRAMYIEEAKAGGKRP